MECHTTIALVHAWEVDLGPEGDDWWVCWVVWSTNDAQEVDTAVEVSTLSNDGSIPVGEGLIIGVVKTVAARRIRKRTLLSLLELLIKLECSWL